MNIKYVSAQEYERLKKEVELSTRFTGKPFLAGFTELWIYEENSFRPLLIKIAPTPLMEELC
jgi:hypothetical protein